MSAAPAPQVSVVMPAYNAEAYIAESIRSVLAQSLAALELIVVDDASTDATVQVGRSFDDPRIVLVRQKRNGGAARARNAGVAQARAPFVALLDADDLAAPERLAVQLEALRRSGADVCASGHRLWNTESGRLRDGHQHTHGPSLKALLTVYCPLANSSVTAKTEWFRRMPWDPGFVPAEDYELWTRMAAAGARFTASPEPLLTYRVHPGQISTSSGKRLRVAADAARAAYLARLGIDAPWVPRQLPWRERLRVAPHFLRLLRARFGAVGVAANYEIYARFQYRGNGLLTPLVRLERLLASLWARFGPPLRD